MPYSQPTWTLAGLTCAFSDPEVTRTAWAFEALKLLREFQVNLEELKRQASQPANLKLTRKRLESLHEPVEFQLRALHQLLQPLVDMRLTQSQMMSYLTESPGPSLLSSNYENLFRDWVWGDVENQEALACIDSVVDAKHVWRKVVVLGAGACRLAYDLHQTKAVEQTTVSDFNPLLMLVAHKIVSGETLELVEFPLMPIEGSKFAVKQKLKAPSAARANLHFALTDATQPGFENEVFNTVVTPWLIDVIRTDLADFLPTINQLLPVGGSWINFGPLGFNNPRVAAHYSIEEVRYLVEKSGFEIRAEKFERIPYMQNPSSNSHRLERVWVAHAVKVKSVEIPDKLHNVLDPWESDPDSPIDIPVAKMNLVAGHKVNAEVLSLVDGKRSFNQIVQKLSQDKDLSQAQAGHILRQILSNAATVSQSNPLRR